MGPNLTPLCGGSNDGELSSHCRSLYLCLDYLCLDLDGEHYSNSRTPSLVNLFGHCESLNPLMCFEGREVWGGGTLTETF